MGSLLNQMHRQQLELTDGQPATAGTLGEKGRSGPSAQVLKDKSKVRGDYFTRFLLKLAENNDVGETMI